MSQGTFISANPPLSLLYASPFSLTTTVMNAPAMVGPPTPSGQQDMVLLPLLTLRSIRCCKPCHCVTTAISVQDAFWGICQLFHGFVIGFFFRKELSLQQICQYMHSTFKFPCGSLFTYGDSAIGVCTTAALVNLSMAYVEPDDSLRLTLGMH